MSFSTAFHNSHNDESNSHNDESNSHNDERVIKAVCTEVQFRFLQNTASSGTL